MIAPVAPTGCPSDMPLPLGLTFSSSNPSSRETAHACAAKASLASITSISPILRPARSSAMRVAAEERVEGILGNSRRRHYGHAALLVASCVACAPKRRAAEFLRWAEDLRQQYWRRHAFREELARASESLGVTLPA